MNISWLTLRDLEYLRAIVQHRHFGRAAESCHVSQPTLSAQIKKIEEFLGVVLFERTNRRVMITEVGQRVADQVKRVLDEAQKIVSVVGQPQSPLSGRLSLGAIATLGPFLIPRFLGVLRKEFPSLHLILEEGLTDSLLRRLREGALDAVLAARTFDEKGFKVFPLFFEPFVLAAPVGHPLLNRARLLSSALNTEEMILLEDGHCLKDQIIEICPANRRGHVRQFHATSIETLRHLVASGLGYTLLPRLAVQNQPKSERFKSGQMMQDLIAYREFDQKNLGREIALICRDRYPGIADVESLARFLGRHTPKEVLRFTPQTETDKPKS